VVVLLLGLIMAADPAGQIAFVSGTNPEEHCVCVMDVASGSVTRIGPGTCDGAPAWSPDGQWLAFESKSGEGTGIRVARADGSESRTLTHQYAWNRYPRWAADNQRLVYSSAADSVLEHYAVVYDLASNTESVWNGGKAGVLRPVWLPNLGLMKALNPDEGFSWEGVDTQKFIVEAWQYGGIIAMGLSGEPGKYSTEPLLLTPSQAAPLLQLLTKDSLRYADWAMESSPKGDRLAFESNDGGDRELYVISKRGIADVTNHRAADWNPVWSPDGKWIAFESFRGSRRGVYRVFPDNARIFPVACSEAYDCWSPAWSPDGEWIVCVSDQGGSADLYLYPVESGEHRVLLTQPGNKYAPAWRPREKS